MRYARCLCLVFLLAALLAPALAPGRSLQPDVGSSITQSELFAYLFTAPQPRDWLRYRITSAGDTMIMKTVGFGQAQVHNDVQAYIEITAASQPILRSPTMQSTNVGGMVVWKMFVDARDFVDPQRTYSITSSAFKIGDGIFRLRNASMLGVPTQRVPLQTLLWSGLVPIDDSRQGTVSKNQPQDLSVQGQIIHCVDVAVDFPESALPGGGRFPAERIEAWQSPDVPLGTVKVRTIVLDETYDANLVAFGRGDYRSIINQSLDVLAPFPGSK